MPVKDSGFLKEKTLKDFIRSNPGITNAMIAQHYSLDIRSVAQWIALHLSTAKWLFYQLRGSTKHYYLAEYATENNITRRMVRPARTGNSKWDKVIQIEHTEYLQFVKRLSDVWPAPKGAT